MIIIKSGSNNISVKDITNNLLSSINDITDLKNMTYNQLIKYKGIGSAASCSILAAIELGTRVSSKRTTLTGAQFTSPEIIFDYYKNKIGLSKQEMFFCIYLDASKRVVKEKMLFKGSLNFSMVEPREVFKEAYMYDALSIICIHNHPSGNVLPSKNDIYLTNRLIEIGNIHGIKIIDHIIIGSTKYYSLFENGDIDG